MSVMPRSHAITEGDTQPYVLDYCNLGADPGAASVVEMVAWNVISHFEAMRAPATVLPLAADADGTYRGSISCSVEHLQAGAYHIQAVLSMPDSTVWRLAPVASVLGVLPIGGEPCEPCESFEIGTLEEVQIWWKATSVATSGTTVTAAGEAGYIGLAPPAGQEPTYFDGDGDPHVRFLSSGAQMLVSNQTVSGASFDIFEVVRFDSVAGTGNHWFHFWGTLSGGSPDMAFFYIDTSGSNASCYADRRIGPGNQSTLESTWARDIFYDGQFVLLHHRFDESGIHRVYINGLDHYGWRVSSGGAGTGSMDELFYCGGRPDSLTGDISVKQQIVCSPALSDVDLAKVKAKLNEEHSIYPTTSLAVQVFGPGGLPTSDMPTSTAADTGPHGPATKLTIDMGEGVVNVAHWHNAGGTELALVHQGHATYSNDGVDTAGQAVFDDGVDVVSLEMVGEGNNTSPWSHNDLGSGSKHVLYYHLYPLVVVLNWCMSQKSYAKVSMFGLSGGGWATTMFSALDDRIDVSVEIAGSLPLQYHKTPKDLEQNLAGKMFQYERYYLDSISSSGRERWQILSDVDPVAFAGFDAAYEDLLATLNAAGPGAVGFLNDGHTAHEINPYRRDYIRWRLGLASNPGDPP